MTDYLIRAALWQIPTMVINVNKPVPELESSKLTKNAMNNLAAHERFRLLEEQVDDAAQAFSRRPPQAGEHVVDLFVAPEYLFARSDVIHFNDEATKDRVCGLIEALSQRHPTMVIVPGTIAWLQPGLRSNFLARLFLEDRGKRALRARKTASGITRTDTKGLKDARKDGNSYWLGRNTAYIYHNGKRLLKYDKRDDGSEVSAADGQRVYFAPGEKDSYFTVDGLEFCLQICAEHGSQPPRPADVQIVIASSHPLRENRGNVRDGGYLLHADAILKPSAKQFVRGAWIDVTAQSRAAASPLTAAEIADRARRGLEAMPATINAAKGDTSIQDAKARRLATAATELGGEIAYYALTYTNSRGWPMTAYLDEYKPGSKSPERRVQSDTRKLKFNNIRSCLALVLLPADGQKLVGVHLTTASTVFHPEEIDIAMKELRAELGGGSCDAYIVANYTQWHARTDLAKALKKLARRVYVCDVPAADGSGEADVDVKVELSGAVLRAYVRRHAVALKDKSGRFIPKPNVKAGGAAVPGKPTVLTDRDDKPWMPVAFQPLP